VSSARLQQAKRAARRSRAKSTYWALALAFGLAQIAAHVRADFTFPPPWIDEAQFLWQAKAVADTGTLLAPQLDPDRPVLWMPPGWFWVAGAAFRVLGFDYSLARSLSLVFLLAAFALLAGMLRGLPQPRASLVLAGAFFLGRTFVAAGNVARMESLLLLAALGGFALLRSGRTWPGLALLAAAPLVHPNGVWFLAGGVAWVWLAPDPRARLGRPDALGVAVLLTVAVAWLGFAALVAAHPDAFAQGFGYQFARKAGATRLGLLFGSRLLALAALVLLARWLRRETPDAVLLACLAAPALLAHTIGQEYWYEIFEELFYLLLSLLALAAAGRWLARQPSLARRSELAVAGLAALLLLVNGVLHRVPNPIGYPGNLVWHRMRVSDGEPYLRDDERAFLRDFLIRLAPPGERPRIRFVPAAEALFYADLDGEEIRVSEPVFREQQPDWILLRASRWGSRGSFERAFQSAGADTPGAPGPILTRGKSERWYAVRR
jgi:hypothetical protein